MNKPEEIHLLLNLILHSDNSNSVDLNSAEIYQSLSLSEYTEIGEDYFFELSEKGIIEYEEIGEDGFKPIIICSVNANTKKYLKESLESLNVLIESKQVEIIGLNQRISELLAFNPHKMTEEIYKIESSIQETKNKIQGDPILKSLIEPLSKIEQTFASIVKVTENYEDVYKSIILPVKEEGKSGVRQTVKWAIISIILSSIISIIITVLSNNYFKNT